MTNRIYEQAQLSEAAYADFWDESIGQVITTEDDVKGERRKKGTQLFSELTGVIHAKEGKSIGTQLPTSYRAARTQQKGRVCNG